MDDTMWDKNLLVVRVDAEVAARRLSLESYARERLIRSVGLHAQRIAQIELRLRDVVGLRGELDSHCQIEIRFRVPRPALTVHTVKPDPFSAITQGAIDAGQLIRRALQPSGSAAA